MLVLHTPARLQKGPRQYSDDDAVSTSAIHNKQPFEHMIMCLTVTVICRDVTTAQLGRLYECSQQHDLCNKALQQQAET